jgi:polysaccharide export outer membrane protein
MVLLLAVAFARMDQPKSTSSGASQPGTTKAGDAAQPPSGSGVQLQFQRYKIQKDDVLVIDFPFTPEYNATVKVQPDGFISARGIKNVKAEGLTTPEVQQALATEYSKILHQPVISVALKSFVVPYFIAYGEVGKPGKYNLYGVTTVTQAIGIAGGFTSDAKHSEVVLFRRISNDWVSAQKLDIKEMLKSGNLAEDPRLLPGDMLWIPKSRVAKALSIQPLIPWNQFHINYGQGIF